MSLVGLDLDSSRARGVGGPSAAGVTPLCLEGQQADLPVAVSLEGRTAVAGRAGLALARRNPHSACLDFLPKLGAPDRWQAGRHDLDAVAAFGLVAQALARPLAPASGVVLALPAYLGEFQYALVHQAIAAARLPLLATLPAPLAAAEAAATEADPATRLDARPGLVLVVDADGYALSLSVVERQTDRLRLRLVEPWPDLGRAAWLRQLTEGINWLCLRQARRDLRESAETEQSLYEQLLRLLDGRPPAVPVTLHLQGAGWSCPLPVRPEELIAVAAPLWQRVGHEVDRLLNTTDALGELVGCAVTAAAAGLPGLLDVVRARLSARSQAAADPDDFGAMWAAQGPGLCELDAMAVARAAHRLAVRVQVGQVPVGHAASLPLPGPPALPSDPGPARLSYLGREFLLHKPSFLIGRLPTCDIVIDSQQHPYVSQLHCEVLLDRAAYLLRDVSRYGTSVNDRLVQQQHAALHTGDWIRLGPQGPVVRFAGRSG